MDIPRMGVPAELADRSLAEQHEYLRSKFSRRTMMRGGAVTLGAVAGGVFVPGAAQAAPAAKGSAAPVSATEHVDGALVAPFGRHLSYGDDARTEMTVSWQVPAPVKSPFIRIGASAGELSRKIAAEVRALYTPAGVGTSADHTQYYVHAKLTHLKPGRTYYYGVGHQGFDPAEPKFAGTVGTFTTAPSHAQPFTFTAFGDQGVSYHALSNDAVILAQGPAFHLHAGDIAYADPSGSGQTTDTFDARTWDLFLAQTESVAKSVPWMVSYGNHDMEAWYSPNGYGSQEARFEPPANGPDPKNLPGVYSFVHGNTAVISLDANDVSWEIPANLGLSGGTQTKWFERQLQKFRAPGSGVDFVVVFFHHCAYCTATSHASEGGVRKEWVPLFEKYTVDLVINGHNHVYERSDVLKGDKVTKELPIGGTAYPETDGVVYVTAGAAGKSLYAFPVADTYEGSEKDIDPFASYVTQEGGGKKAVTVDWSRVRYTNYSFLRVDVQPAPVGRTATLTVRGLSEAGAEIDRFVVARRVKR
ncbi:phosphoesterase [Streptomyces sp. SID8379]|uniref:purple acid phosphatase family protein n=1 Tax=unclassified Streptomyces TaxID=2593676 RepID=UPI0005B810BB|nr:MULTISPECIES: metallophosphoesterase family protein [unclassified Streptomyces]MYW65969.1 phosphoesterase [Streptomyces sp. SID8379]